MKFISKSNNLLVVLTHGIQADPMVGRLATPMLSVRFKNGVAEVNDTDLIEKMKNHSGFNTDFVAVEEEGEDPYSYMRGMGTEPKHVIYEIEHGTVKSLKGGEKEVPAALQRLIKEEAAKMAKEMLPDFVREAIKEQKMLNQDTVSDETEEDLIPEPIVSGVKEETASNDEASSEDKPKGEEKKDTGSRNKKSTNK